MQLHSVIVDDFLMDFERWRAWADEAAYGDIINTEDGVTYPGICADIPDELRDDVHHKLCMVLATNQLKIRTMFTRLSVRGVHVPHQAHNDASMGMFSLMVYLNRDEHCRVGTELLRHTVLDMEYGPEDDGDLRWWQIDTNQPDAWEVLSTCRMKPNRAFIFDSRLMHRAQPIGGFGKDAKDGRLVLTAFFDV